MLKLFLLRHAQAANSFDMGDKDRPLTSHGVQQAKILGATLPEVDLVLCSAANRTKMTLEALQAGGFNLKKFIFIEEIYNAPAGDVLNAIQQQASEAILMVIAHNPGIHQLANALSKEDGSSQREKLRYDYAPASLSILECPIENWIDIQPQENKLAELVIPA